MIKSTISAFVILCCFSVAGSMVVVAFASKRASELTFQTIKIDSTAGTALRDNGVLTNGVVDTIVAVAADAQLNEGEQSQPALALLADFVAPKLAYVTVEEGMRVEQVADTLAEELEWDEGRRHAFVGINQACTEELREGMMDPGTYAVSPDANPVEVRETMKDSFDERVAQLVEEAGSPLSVRDALIVASMIQREAAGAHDMGLISGIIWNRIFLGMSLDIDATLQYAKVDEIASQGKEVKTWWPMVRSKDKYIDSPFNTYLNDGFPPSPIATPSDAAILAALNPEETDCLFYLHDNDREIHCAKDYAQHKRNVTKYLK
jgi:UPF0755 protein